MDLFYEQDVMPQAAGGQITTEPSGLWRTQLKVKELEGQRVKRLKACKSEIGQCISNLTYAPEKDMHTCTFILHTLQILKQSYSYAWFETKSSMLKIPARRGTIGLIECEITETMCQSLRLYGREHKSLVCMFVKALHSSRSIPKAFSSCCLPRYNRTAYLHNPTATMPKCVRWRLLSHPFIRLSADENYLYATETQSLN